MKSLTKRFTILFVFLCVSLLVAPTSYAEPNDAGQSWQNAYQNYRERLDSLLTKRYEKILELNRMLRSGVDSSDARLEALENEIGTLDAKIHAEQYSFDRKYGHFDGYRDGGYRYGRRGFNGPLYGYGCAQDFGRGNCQGYGAMRGAGCGNMGHASLRGSGRGCW